VKDAIVLIPTYNEIENIELIIRKVLSLEVSFHILIIDDGSPDGTAQKVKELQDEFVGQVFLEERKGKLGLGTAYIHGFKIALAKGYEYIFEMDADFSHNPEDLVRLYYTAKQGHDLVVGSRYIKGITVVNWPLGRVLMSYFASQYVHIITGMPVKDATAGFKCYHRSVLEKIELDKIRFVGYAFQIEMKFMAWKHGFDIEEIPIIFIDRTRGVSKMSSKIFKEAFFGVLQIKISSWFRKFDKK